MTEETGLTTVPGGLIPVAQMDEAQLASVREEATASGGQPYVRMYGAKSKEATARKIASGHFGIAQGSGDPEDLGESCDVIIVASRSRAVDTKNKKNFYVRESAGYQHVKEQSSVQNSGMIYGPEFLVWVGSVQKFATFHCNSKTLRNIANELLDAVGKAVTLGWRLAENANYTWDAVSVTPMTDWGYEKPEGNVISATSQKFLTQTGNDTEEVAGSDPAEAGSDGPDRD